MQLLYTISNEKSSCPPCAVLNFSYGKVVVLIPCSLVKNFFAILNVGYDNLLKLSHFLHYIYVLGESTMAKCKNNQIDVRNELNVYSFLSKSIFDTLDTYFAKHQYIVIAYEQYQT